ncbi:MAG TPA: RsiV family protein [Pyrinomonadaceae bacterium]|nr:RsiV family protein [Pyrinomonadaceae bacterium]
MRNQSLTLADLFEPRAKFLQSIAAYCVGKFEREGLSCGPDGFIDREWLAKGPAPTKDNYASWALTREGLRVTFGEYQIGPGCLGLVKVVVPYEHLGRLLRRDGPLRARAVT